MATDLYEVLGLDRAATQEEIRRAYRKKALETHPDRFPRGASLTEKESYEERFRKVNNAYEILHDDQKRRLYDLHGAWPPPEMRVREQEYTGTRQSRDHQHSPGHNPFFCSDLRFGSDPFTPFTFTDPFVLFNSMAADFGFFMDGPAFSPFGGFGQFPFGTGRLGNQSFGYPGMSRVNGFGYVSTNITTTTINGRTESVEQRIDSKGNNHTWRNYGDGHEIYTINGVEQPTTAGYLLPNSLQRQHYSNSPRSPLRNTRVDHVSHLSSSSRPSRSQNSHFTLPNAGRSGHYDRTYATELSDYSSARREGRAHHRCPYY